MKYFYRGVFNPQRLAPDNIDRLSTALVPPNSYLLELGCANGFMSRYFKSVKRCRVVGVELDRQAVSHARPYSRVICADLEHKTTWAKIKAIAPFDVVFASAIIEHLRDPWQILQLIKSVLKPNGLLIITTSNIAHWRMRFQLLLGRWRYEDYGTLDNTHLKFFTYHTFKAAIQDAGFAISKIAIDPAGGIKYFDWLARHFPNFYAHQMVISARKL